MPSGGYGLNPKDGIMIRKALDDEDVKRFGMQYEWLWAYVSARTAGATPEEASTAAYVEWDL